MTADVEAYPNFAPSAAADSDRPGPNTPLPPAEYRSVGQTDLWGDWRSTFYLTRYLTMRNVSTRYRGSALGFLWTMINPLLTMLVYTFVFKFLFRAPSGNVPYALYFLSGILAWQFFSTSANNAANSITEQSNIIRKSWFPRVALPLSSVFANAVNYLLTVPILLVLLAFVGVLPTWKLLVFFPIAVAMLLTLAIGVGLFLAALAPFFRDILQLMDVLLQVWFFATPVAYLLALPKDHLTTHVGSAAWYLYCCNPMVGIMSLVHGAYLGMDIEVLPVLLSATSTLILFGIGWSFFKSMEPYFADGQ